MTCYICIKYRCATHDSAVCIFRSLRHFSIDAGLGHTKCNRSGLHRAPDSQPDGGAEPEYDSVRSLSSNLDLDLETWWRGPNLVLRARGQIRRIQKESSSQANHDSEKLSIGDTRSSVFVGRSGVRRLPCQFSPMGLTLQGSRPPPQPPIEPGVLTHAFTPRHFYKLKNVHDRWRLPLTPPPRSRSSGMDDNSMRFSQGTTTLFRGHVRAGRTRVCQAMRTHDLE